MLGQAYPKQNHWKTRKPVHLEQSERQSWERSSKRYWGARSGRSYRPLKGLHYLQVQPTPERFQRQWEYSWCLQTGNTAIRQHEFKSWKEKGFGIGDLGSNPELAVWHWRSHFISPRLSFFISKPEVTIRSFLSWNWHGLNELVHVQVPETQ